MLDKKNGLIEEDWYEICQRFNLDLSADTLRKSAMGVKLAYDAGKAEPDSTEEFIERQKVRDLTTKFHAMMRTESRSELLREAVVQAIEKLPRDYTGGREIGFPRAKDDPDRALVVCLGDMHFGADIDVRGLRNEQLNRYNEEVFRKRMDLLLCELTEIINRERVENVHVFLVGDLIDGILRQSQLMRLEYGLVESVIRFSEYMAWWINELSCECATVRVAGVTGNHSEIRPLKAKAREFEEENLERIINFCMDIDFDGIDLDEVKSMEFLFVQEPGCVIAQKKTQPVTLAFSYPSDTAIRMTGVDEETGEEIETNSVELIWTAEQTYMFKSGAAISMDTRIHMKDLTTNPETPVLRFVMDPTLFKEYPR